jgi:hypothetical protein
MGQWTGAVRIVRPWFGAGLTYGCRRSPERVWTLGSVTLLARPLESLPTALTVKGAGGGETAGTDANVGVDVGRVVAVPEGGAGVVRIVDPRAPAQQLGDPPSPLNQAHGLDEQGD